MLYIVATPIGNLKDITLRAVEVLKSVDIVFCEDTRQTKKLLDHYQIDKKMISLHQHSSDEKIAGLLRQFENIAYVTDAGTPGISDPGNRLVEIAIQLNVAICPIPGPSAAIAALSVAGFATDKFLFLGFLPKKGQQKVFEKIKNSDCAVCFYESPHRILKTLGALEKVLEPTRQMVICRELTKKFETIYRGTAEELLKQVKPKGEFVIIIAP
ncbi:MAG: 16S rRNA (cytidine(1402)-2'-O)-methyltransferase [Candidatus Falkowbacteria bacterium]